MNWKIKASLQKFLSFTRLGDKLNHIPVTLSKEYHKNVFKYQSWEAVRRFDYCGAEFLKKERVALEIGTGYSLISAITLYLLGFKKIITVDISPDVVFSNFKKQSQYLNDEAFINAILTRSIYNKGTLLQKMETISNVKDLKSLFEKLNIIYLAPYQFEDIEKYQQSFDYITSQVVFEHISPEILDSLFKKMKNWLVPDGFSIHTINFIDHFANPGFFQDKTISEFNFLKYSNTYWQFWAGNSIAYVNRLSYIYYLELAEKNGFLVDFRGENYRERVLLDERFIHADVVAKYACKVNLTDLTKYQRGTLLLTKS